MSDKVVNAIMELEIGHNITTTVNDEMTRAEQLQLARKLWDMGDRPHPKQGSNEICKTVGNNEVTFRIGKDSQTEVSDIVFRGTSDLYDTPEESRRNAPQDSRRNPLIDLARRIL